MTLDDIKAVCQSYITEAERLESERKIGDGLFGIGRKPADDPCHDKFADDMEKVFSELADEKPGSDLARDILSYIYHLPKEHEKPVSIYWMLNAIHGLTLPVIEFLSPGDAGILASRYASDFRRWDRLPAQEQVYKALKRKAK